MPLRPGETFGRYQLAELLGQGGMGEVYSAYDTVLHRKVALKVLTAPASPFGDSPPSTKGAARILREARAAAGIAHPNAVPIYDVGEVDGVPFLAMELVAGRTLRSFIGDESVPLGRRIRWIADIARALAAAHQLGLVHRDIKPENVMVRDDGIVKVLDFGIARRAVDPAASAPPAPSDLAALSKLAVTNGTLTAEGAVLGTPMYMAPEQLLGEELDGRTDQFSWGVLAHEVLTGKLPWDGEGVMLLSQILSKEVGPLADSWPEIPEPVDEAIRRALRKAREDRFAGMDEIADALEPFAGTTGQSKQLKSETRDLALATTEQAAASSQDGLMKSGAPALTQGSAEPRGRGRSWAALGAAAAVIALGVWGARALSSPRAATPAAADAAPADLPSQMSSNPDANAAYRAGLQGLRDGTLGAALKQLGRATELDPLFGAAQLRLALTKLLDNTVDTITSADLQPAHAAQASLGTRDRILLDAFELIASVPRDYDESRRLLEAAVQKYPTDGDLPFQLALMLDVALMPEDAEKAIEVSITRDPTFAFAWRLKGGLRVEIDDSAGAMDAFENCLRVSPGATTCLADLTSIQSNEGQCTELVKTSRRLIALVPDSFGGYQALAQGLLGSGEPVDAVRAALRQSWDRQPAPSRPLAAAFAEASLSILAGDFVGADARLKECERLTASYTDDWNRFNVAYSHVLLDIEVGRTGDARRIAEGYLRERSGLSQKSDCSLVIEAAELGGGILTRAQFDDLRRAWLARNQDVDEKVRWREAYALPAETREDAATALALKPHVQPLVNAFGLYPDRAEALGRAHALGGQMDIGVSYLTKAAASCNVLYPHLAMFSTWAAFDLGAAAEERGDTAGACAAYRTVVTRWGEARSPSRTAAKALGRRRALGCSP